MTLYEFLIIPEIIFTTGIVLYSVLFIKSFKNMKGDIDLHYLKKEDIEKLSPDKRKIVRISTLKITVILTIATSLIGIASYVHFKNRISGLIICLVLQTSVSAVFSRPYFGKLKKIKKSVNMSA